MNYMVTMMHTCYPRSMVDDDHSINLHLSKYFCYNPNKQLSANPLQSIRK